MYGGIEKAKDLYFSTKSDVNFGAWFVAMYKDMLPTQHRGRIAQSSTMKQALRTIKELGYE